MPYILSNNGDTIKWHHEGYVPQNGEIDIGNQYPSEEELKKLKKKKEPKEKK